MKKLIKTHGKPKKEVYFDSENSGLIFPEALKELIKAYRKTGYGNPAITHKIGWESYEKLYKATEKLSKILNVSQNELTYTHNATEANNLAIIGAAKANKTEKKKIIVSSIEHLSVIFAAEELQKHGYKIVKVPVDKEGFVNKEFINKEVDKETFLVSIAPINHEIGVIQDLKEISELIKDKNPNTLFHVDASDAFGRIKLNLDKIDLASFSSHKIYGPKGAGLLYTKEGVKLEPIIHGQLTAQKLWPSVENIPAIAGFAKAAELIHLTDMNKISRLRDKLIEGILNEVDQSMLNGPKGFKRAPDNVNISFLNIEGEAVTVELSMRGVYVSSGSACTSRILQPSHVLLAIGRRYEEAHGSILMKITPFHNEEDIEYSLNQIYEGVKRLQLISPIKGG
ncbi:MAG: cysteine desulfurase family protein [Candidatus Bathyarchaeia archaeon]